MNGWLLNKYPKVHIIGIGGIGMSAIARMLLGFGFKVTGSDLNDSKITRELKDLGAVIFKGHSGENIADQDLVIYSSAVKPDNPELAKSKELSIPVMKRPVILHELMRGYYGIGIAGSHGKTTTTGMTASILIEAGFDPAVIVGGILKELDNTNARVGNGDYFVMEADEYDRTFLALNPVVEVITNVEAEHMDTYKRYENVINAFVEFANKVPFYGNIFACIDEPGVKDILPFLTSPVVTYGLSEEADVRAFNIRYKNGKATFDVKYFEEDLGQFELSVPGVHNVKNALGAISVGMELRAGVENIKKALAKFKGAERRFQIILEEPVKVIDDYAHHPSEVKATLEAAKSFEGRKIIAVFQPHLYSRTLDFRKQFAAELATADEVIIMDVYPAREEPIEGVSGKLIVDELNELKKENVFYVPGKNELIPFLQKKVSEGNIVIGMGAGDITHYIREFARQLKKQSGESNEN